MLLFLSYWRSHTNPLQYSFPRVAKASHYRWYILLAFHQNLILTSANRIRYCRLRYRKIKTRGIEITFSTVHIPINIQSCYPSVSCCRVTISRIEGRIAPFPGCTTFGIKNENHLYSIQNPHLVLKNKANPDWA